MPPKRMPNVKRMTQGDKSSLVWGVAMGISIAVLVMLLMNLRQQANKPSLAAAPVPAPEPKQHHDNVGQDMGLGVVPQLYRSAEPPIGIQARLAERDRRVDGDNLYPPLSRERVLERDTFRPVAYLVAEEEQGARNDVWKLYARERSRGGASDFYAVSADRQFDAKVALTDENVQSQPRLRDVYNLPTAVQIRHPMFRPNTTYQLVEMDRADWGNTPNYF